ncbi:complement C1q tumor necrosis factor-related protein 3-like [Astatotilapia calliptera]|uniref:C1q domain-containing protein n=1 Tax=Astatotilapia calliptera TaxID=8154 RepID=A0A3P8RBA8_ASTCA|nr:complement C1q tumor necrosis factor-related protein 3-like [Astatotilapia calliptera]
MEIMVFFSLLLLVCSVSTNLTEADNEIVDQQISNQQPCQQDIHAVLREMAVSLAVQKAQIMILQKENQDHSTKLDRQTTEIDQLKQQLQDKQVAFSTSLLDRGTLDIGPFNTDTTLIFKQVFTNIGNAYNPHTGIFTAPVRGVYHFECHAYGYADIMTRVELFKNGERIFIILEFQPSHIWTSSNGASLLLEAGDHVFLRLSANARVRDSQGHHTTFSGHLLFTM